MNQNSEAKPLDLTKPIETLNGRKAKVVVEDDNEIVIISKNPFGGWSCHTFKKNIYVGIYALERYFRNKKEKKVCIAYLNIDCNGKPTVHEEEYQSRHYSGINWPVRARKVEFEYEI